MYQQRMMLPCAHHGYDGDSATAGAAVLREMPTPNMTDVMVASRTRYLMLMIVYLFDADILHASLPNMCLLVAVTSSNFA